MGVETKVPDESSPGVKYPRYGELGPEWRGQDRVFVNRELFDKMAAGRSGFDVRSFYSYSSPHDNVSDKLLPLICRNLLLSSFRKIICNFEKRHLMIMSMMSWGYSSVDS